MTHRVHPKVFRIKEITDWDSRGFYRKKLPEYLEEDFKMILESFELYYNNNVREISKEILDKLKELKEKNS